MNRIILFVIAPFALFVLGMVVGGCGVSYALINDATNMIGTEQKPAPVVERSKLLTELQPQNDNQNISAFERMRNITKMEADSRIMSGFTKMSIGAITLISVSQGIGGFDVAGLAGMATGPIILFGTGITFWGISDIWYYQTGIEKECKKIANLDPAQREGMAAEYLNIKANQVEQERKKNDLWNLFGLIPKKPESQVEKEYREYLEEHPSVK